MVSQSSEKYQVRMKSKCRSQETLELSVGWYKKKICGFSAFPVLQPQGSGKVSFFLLSGVIC